MITLCGMPISNYYNKVKLALLEKGVPFVEEPCPTKSTDEAVLAASPLAKIPFVRTDRGGLCESAVILEWLEATHPQPPLLPADAWAAAKVREIETFVDLHLELVARELYTQAFFGGTVSEETKERVRTRLVKQLAGFKRLAQFAPYVAGAEFTRADCSAYPSLPLVARATQRVLGEDLVLAAGVDWKTYCAVVAQRPSALRVDADRKASTLRP